MEALALTLFIGIALNCAAYVVHIVLCDPDPTHEDLVILFMLGFCFVPYLVFVIVGIELIKQKVFNIHYGVKRK